MKKILCCALMLAMLLTSAAVAEIPQLSEEMLRYAVAALDCLSRGAYDKVVTNLPFSDVAPSADEWQGLAEYSFTTLSGSEVQDYSATAYWNGRMWKIAVPVEEPAGDDTEALILLSQDGTSFSGYGYALWEDVEKEMSNAAYMVWLDEYSNFTSAIVESDE